MRIAAWSGLVLSGLGLIVLLLLGALVYLNPEPSMEGIGNRRENLIRVSKGGPDFRFAVLGDTQKGIATFRKLSALVSDVDFAVHCGDMVADNDEGHWRLFLNAVNVRPLVSAAGNHDVKRGEENFTTYFGPSEFSFGRGSCLFVVINNGRSSRYDAPGLEQQLRASPAANKIIIMHRTPFDPKKDTIEPMPGYEPFFELLERYGVRYVFTGHSHEYRRREHKGTVFITNGEGGDRDAWVFDTKAKATVLTVRGDRIRERVMEIEPVYGLWSEAEHAAVGHLWMAYRHRPFTSWGGTLILMALFGFCLRFVLRPKPVIKEEQKEEPAPAEEGSES